MLKKCKCCGKEKPESDYYSSGTMIMARCKECMAIDREISTEFNKYKYEPLDQWPSKLIANLRLFKCYANQGGKIDYARSASKDAIELYDYLVELQADTEGTADTITTGVPYDDTTGEAIFVEDQAAKKRNAAVLELTNQSDANAFLRVVQMLNAEQNMLRSTVKELRVQITDLNRNMSKLQNDIAQQCSAAARKDKKDAKEAEAKDRRRRRDLINKIGADEHVKELMAKEFPDLLIDLTDAYKEIQEQGYLSPKSIYKIVIPFEWYGYAIPLDLDEYYRTYLMPGIEAARQRDDYKELTDWLYDHIQNEHYNYYEEDWSNIPLAG